MLECRRCDSIKPKSEFYKANKTGRGYQYFCKECCFKTGESWRKANVEKVRANARRQSKKPRDRFMAAKRTAKRRGYSWSLTEREYLEIISDECFYCEGFFGKVVSGSGLDREHNDIGYTYDNCVSCCKICNKIKNEFLTLNETLVAVEAIIKERKRENG